MQTEGVSAWLLGSLVEGAYCRPVEISIILASEHAKGNGVGPTEVVLAPGVEVLKLRSHGSMVIKTS